MAKDVEPIVKMAEDTRLADACLLLNFPDQSYREQLMLFEQSKNTCSTGQQETTDISEPPIVKPLQPGPPCSSSSHIGIGPVSQSLESEVLLPYSNTSSLRKSNSDANLKDRLGCLPNQARATRDPISNLLAAVNCALPGVKTLPNILQRSSTSLLSSRPQHTALLPSPPDHNYCQRVQVCAENPSGPTIHGKLVEPRFNDEDKSSTVTTYPSKALKLVAVHLGAGSGGANVELLRFARTICQDVMSRDSDTTECKILRRKRKQTCNSNSFEGNSRICECQNVIAVDNRMTAEAAVVQLVKYMENNHALNCGYGSNLNLNGQVECDASLMSDRTVAWAGVGAVSGCKNPIVLAKSLYDHRLIHRPLGLVQPNLLVGSGAKHWMREHCPHLSVMDSKMLSSKSFSTYQKLKSSYDASIKKSSDHHRGLACSTSTTQRHRNSEPSCSVSREKHQSNSPKDSPISLDHGFYCLHKRERTSLTSPEAQGSNRGPSYIKDEHICENHCDSTLKFGAISNDSRLDTVGAVAVDKEGNFACAISSGGLLLKYKGRVGQAAVPGAGCWSESSLAATTTGVGEYLSQSLFAKKFHDKVQTLRLLYDLGHIDRNFELTDLISCCMEECFEDLLNSSSPENVEPEKRLAGALAVSSLNTRSSPSRCADDSLYLTYAHNTNSMCIGYMTCDDTLGHSFISERGDDMKGGKPSVETLKINLK